MMSDILTHICEDKRAHVAACKNDRALADLEDATRQASPPRGFAARLRGAVDRGGYGLIA